MEIDIQNLSFNFKTQNMRIQRFLSQRVKSRLLWHQTVEGRQHY